jgi:predicted amidohydrolase
MTKQSFDEGAQLVEEIRVSVVSWGVRKIHSDEEFFRHLESLLLLAKDRGSSVVVLPELFEVELLTAFGDGPESEVAKLLAPYAPKIDEQLALFAKQLGITIVGGSYLRNAAAGVLNLATIAAPTGELRFQPKNCRTQWEIEPWGLVSTTGIQTLIDPRMGVLVCYDVEFPEAARAQACAGVQLLCVPSYTESQHGYQRVHWCCRARAVENEIFVAQACLVGPIECFGLGTGYGRSSILTPSKGPFPDSAVIAETAFQEEGIATAKVSFRDLATCRGSGDVRLWNDRSLSAWQLLP